MKGKNNMKRLFLILYSIFFIIGCSDYDVENFVGNIVVQISPPHSECPDSSELNYYGEDCDITGECPSSIEDCIYCEDEYDTEEERFENCCNIPDAENYSGYFGDNNNNWSVDSTYCIFD